MIKPAYSVSFLLSINIFVTAKRSLLSRCPSYNVKDLECGEWRRMEKISWIDRVRNEEVYTEARKTGTAYLHTINKRKANWIGQILRRNCLLKYIIKGNVEGKINIGGIEH